MPESAPLQFALAPLLFGAVFAGLGGMVLTRLFQQLARGPHSEAWPSVSGEIVRSELRDTTGDGTSPFVRYRYQVEGQEFEGRSVDWAVRHTPKRESEELVARYPVGAAVTVYYDPGKPSIAVLEPGAADNQRAAVILGGVFAGLFTLLGLGMIAVGIVYLF